MKLNENAQINGSRVILVPYEPEHVEKYHKWMEDEEIRRLTGSERLSLQEECEMQQSWRNDEDKLTFILLSVVDLVAGKNEIDSMIGDVNLFMDNDEKTAEAEVMIAEERARGKGIASEALQLLFSYALQKLQIQTFFVKITDDNEASIHLFKKLGFKQIFYSSAFKEYTFELPHDTMDQLREHLRPEQITEYRRR